MAVIVIDPGHGGTKNVAGSSANNATGPGGLEEKNVTRAVAKAMRGALANSGHIVQLTRSTDVNLGLQARAAVAKNAAAHVFISIHFNGWTDPVTQGTETWLHTNHTLASSELANLVQQRLLGVTGHRDRGVKSMGLGVLNPSYHHARTAACLAEISFITVPAEEARLKTTAYVIALGNALAQAALAYVATNESLFGAIEATHASALASPVATVVTTSARVRRGKAAGKRSARRARGGRITTAAATPAREIGCAAHLDGKVSDEATAWQAQSKLALAAIGFWEKFLGLGVKTGPGDPPPTRELTADERTRLITIMRAVSWVESRHGTGAGASASVDPMQCGHPQDAWWREITAQVAQYSFFDRNVGLKDVYSKALPGEAEAATGWPNAVRLASLDDVKSGHDDAHFDPRYSYYWGVPWLVHRINRHPVYLCKDFSREALVKGAVTYNGGGDPSYRKNIETALDLIGALD